MRLASISCISGHNSCARDLNFSRIPISWRGKGKMMFSEKKWKCKNTDNGKCHNQKS